ncbi:potassium channel family protein [Streptomyces tailanensis]|uniref:potassium channel family protein n=1 Tax=Streptomyces tailanensis TaxID=2569858 RepID=UPI00319EB629
MFVEQARWWRGAEYFAGPTRGTAITLHRGVFPVNWLISAVGVVVVLAALRDLFHTIWHPTRRGGLSQLIMTAMWRLSHLLPFWHRTAGLVGPLGMVAVVGTWALAVVLGWALIYWPHMPEAFAFAQGLVPSERADLLDAVYVSLVMVGTLGLGDIAPEAGWLRIAAPLEALIGFVLLSATVAWVLELYPALARRRALAVRLALLRHADPGMRLLESSAGATTLDSLAGEVVRVRIDFAQYPEAYYFHDGADRTSLAVMVRHAVLLAERGQAAGRTEVRLTAGVLAAALDDLAKTLDQRHLYNGGSRGNVFDAYAADHRQTRPAAEEATG